ncbi:hypothetical protein B2G71_02770 [Novosphingobium sp. PC22D]|uniref:hypothetical protein n=1 Tax=Novosphingobium sp. PC22D TaxID=1962403 RepID=UPI000BF05AC8|nr:hypothetical protein [Novosphingobium sp. PC22D]PEQ14519.1 hypothetical protein B2G71_02770 [Novosphingobium sp. PC22D]
MKFDSMLAWRQASAAIAANRDVLLAIAGVCFFLPSLVLALFFPQPEPTAGMDEQAIMQLASDYYVSLLPVLIPMVLLQAVGTLSLILLLTDRSRPTVGEALRAGTRCVIAYLLAQLLLGIAVGLGGGIVLAAFSASGVPVLVGLGMGLVVALIAVAATRTSLTAAVIAVEAVRNPIEALRRSIALTQGNTMRVLAFYVLILLGFLVLSMLVTLIVGMPLSLLAPVEVAHIVNSVVSAMINATMALYFVSIIAAVHNQFARIDSLDTFA